MTSKKILKAFYLLKLCFNFKKYERGCDVIETMSEAVRQ